MRSMATAYMPSGNTMLQTIGSYLSGSLRTMCFQTPNRNGSGINQVVQDRIIRVMPSIKGVWLAKKVNWSWLSSRLPPLPEALRLKGDTENACSHDQGKVARM